MLLVVVAAWGVTWPVNKVILRTLSPFWMTALRSAIATVVVFAIAIGTRRLVLPTRSDLPVVLSITCLHMVGFVVLANVGLQLVPTGRSMLLAYTTPLWVIPAASLLLKERLTAKQVIGVVAGIAGLVMLFNPATFDWSDRRAVLGNAATLVAALLWAANIVHLRAHRWHATPFELVPWETLLATVLLMLIALVSGGVPDVAWNATLVVLMLYSGVIGTALAYWAFAVASRNLPAVTIALGMLGAPVLGIVVATLWLGEPLTVSLVLAVALILGGIALGTRVPVQR